MKKVRNLPGNTDTQFVAKKGDKKKIKKKKRYIYGSFVIFFI